MKVINHIIFRAEYPLDLAPFSIGKVVVVSPGQSLRYS